MSGAGHTDSSSLTSGQTYYYVVRSEDDSGNGSGQCNNGNEDTNTVEVAGVPFGPTTVFVNEDFEEAGGEPTNGGTWSHLAGQGTDDWAQTTGGNPHSPTHTFFSSDVQVLKDDYLITPSITLGASSNLTFWHTYAMESGFDGCVIEISTNGGSTWIDLGPKITQGAYNGTISNNYNSPIKGRQAWTGGSIGTETEVIVDLSAYDTQTVQVRFRLACDTSVSSTGWYVDDVVIMSSTACTPGTGGSTPQEASPAGSPMTATKGAGSAVNVSYTAASCATDHAVYSGTSPIVTSLSWTAAACGRGTTGTTSFDPGTPTAGTFVYFAIVGQTSSKEGSYGQATAGERPEATGFGSCDLAQDLTGTSP